MLKFLSLFLCLLASSCMTQKQRVEIAHTELTAFFAFEPNIKKELILEDARFTLLHIPQSHYSKIYCDKLLEKFELWQVKSDLSSIAEEQDKYSQLIQKIDSEQKSIINFLRKHQSSYDCLYVEGLAYPGTYATKKPLQEIAQIKDEVNRALQFADGTHCAPQPAYFAGASLFLYQEDKIPMLGVEHQALLRLTHKAYSKEYDSKVPRSAFIQACHEERETQMIKNMSKKYEANNRYDRSIKFLLCGSLHDFKDNVLEWNKLHPEMKFNLLILEP